MDSLALIAMLCALLVGCAIGWTLFGRGAKGVAAERDDWREKATRALGELGRAELRAGQADALEAALATVRGEGDAARHELAALRSAAAERERAFAAQIEQLRVMEAKLQESFGTLAAKAMNDAQSLFLKRADERFQQAGEASEGKLKALLSPVEQSLKRYDEKLDLIEKSRADSYGALKEAVGRLTEGNEVVRRETARLTNVLRSSPKARGRWGEEQLRTILEQAGLAENVDFTLQSSVSDEGRQLRPDCVINLPGGRCIVIDVKCPLVAFEQAFDEEDEQVRAGLLLSHANAMKSYANDLGRKAYWRQFDLSPDFVIMFIPGEHFLSAAAERAPDLIESAFRQGVIIASTINMLALAKVMAGMWRQEALAEQAQEVATVGKELYKRLATMGGHVAKLGRNLSLATGAYNDMVGSLESQVMTQAKRFEALKVETGGKPIEPLPLAETGVRPLTKLAVVEDAAGADTQAAE